MSNRRKQSSTKSSKATAKTRAKKRNVTPPRSNTPRRKRAFPVKSAIAVGVFVAVIVGGLVMLQTFFAQRFPLRTSIGEIRIGGMSQEEVEVMLSDYVNALDETGMAFWYSEESFSIMPTISSTEGYDLSYDIYAIDIEKTLDRVWDGTHGSTWVGDVASILRVLAFGYHSDATTIIDTDELELILRDVFIAFDDPAANSTFTFSDDGTITTSPHQSGIVLDYDSGINEMYHQLASLTSDPIILEQHSDKPTVEQSDTEELIPSLKSILDRAPYTLLWKDHTWEFDRDTVEPWFTAKRNPDGDVQLAFEPETLTDSFAADITSFIDVDVQEGKFVLENERVTEFQPSMDGREVNISATAEQMRSDIIDTPGSQSAVIVTIVEPQYAIHDLNDLGIKELIGVGKSNMRGSPQNRRYNINVGVDTLNGILIPPDETFSLVTALGEIDADHGYRQELVIKGNETVPEFGGGLCQIGTTTFRAALSSGLPIIERQNHSYQVSYYFDDQGRSGTDATIYDPAPDFKFTNDTGNHIMLQTRVDGNLVIFEFWGTRDDRIVEQTAPVMSNYVTPPPTKIVETTDLAPGERKCTESAHVGATSVFTYTVTYPDGRVDEENFKSVYKPWQEVCLIGVDPSELEDKEGGEEGQDGDDSPPPQVTGDDTGSEDEGADVTDDDSTEDDSEAVDDAENTESE